MNLTDTRQQCTRLVLLAGIAMALALAALSFAPDSNPTATAQSLEGCREYSVCVTKDTIGGDGEFLFELAFLEGDIPEFCMQAEETDEKTIVLSDGDSFGLFIRCAVRITETPQRGWQLVDVNCNQNKDLWDITRIPNGILIVSNPGNVDDVDYSFECTFVNQRIEERPLNLGGLFAGQPTPLPTAPAAVAPAATSPVITPPRTGDAGLR